MSDDSGSLQRQRRMLLIFSVGLIVYYLGGGELLPEGRLMAQVLVKFKYPGVLLVSVWLGFAYAWYRYALYSRELRKKWLLRVRRHLPSVKRYRTLRDKFFNDVIVPGLSGLVDNFEGYVAQKYRKPLAQLRDECLPEFEAPFLAAGPKRIFVAPRMHFERSVEGSHSTLNSLIEAQAEAVKAMDVIGKDTNLIPLWQALLIVLEAWWRGARQDEEVTEYSVPYILAWCALVVGAVVMALRVILGGF